MIRWYDWGAGIYASYPMPKEGDDFVAMAGESDGDDRELRAGGADAGGVPADDVGRVHCERAVQRRGGA